MLIAADGRGSGRCLLARSEARDDRPFSAIAAAGVRDVGSAVQVTLSQQASTSGPYLRTT